MIGWLVMSLLATSVPTERLSPCAGTVTTVSRGRGLFSFDAKGRLRWRYALPANAVVVGDPACDAAGNLALRTNTELFILDSHGSPLVRTSLARPGNLPESWLGPRRLGSKQLIVVLGAGEIASFDTAGTLQWRYVLPHGQPLASAPMIVGELVYLRSDRDLYALSARGTLLWSTAVVQ